jgi:hypothetical protein
LGVETRKENEDLEEVELVTEGLVLLAELMGAKGGPVRDGPVSLD